MNSEIRPATFSRLQKAPKRIYPYDFRVTKNGKILRRGNIAWHGSHKIWVGWTVKLSQLASWQADRLVLRSSVLPDNVHDSMRKLHSFLTW
jgi:hypothetical protein